MELVDEPGRDAPAQPDRTAARRARVGRLLRRWWPLPVAAAVGVVAWQVVDDARERAAVAPLRATASVIGTTVTPPLTATAWGAADATAVLSDPARTEDGLLAGAVLTPAAGWELVALDAADGSEAWRVTLQGPPEGISASASVDCAPDGDPARTLACVATTQQIDPMVGTLTVRSQLLQADLAARTVQPVRDLPDGTSVTVAGDVLVQVDGWAATPDALVVTGTDLATGDPLWRTEIPAAGTDHAAAATLRRLDGHVLIGVATATWALDPADGRVEASGTDLQAPRSGGRLVDVAGSSSARVFGPDGEVGAELDATPVLLGIDDGSVPDVLLLWRFDGSMGGTLLGVDAATGEQRWAVPMDQALVGGAVLLDGVLHVSDGPTVRALDAATGAERWATAGGTDGGVTSDGVSLLRVERDTGTGERVLVAYALADGRRSWSTPLPEEAASLFVRDGRLFGLRDEQVVLLG